MDDREYSLESFWSLETRTSKCITRNAVERKLGNFRKIKKISLCTENVTPTIITIVSKVSRNFSGMTMTIVTAFFPTHRRKQ